MLATGEASGMVLLDACAAAASRVAAAWSKVNPVGAAVTFAGLDADAAAAAAIAVASA